MKKKIIKKAFLLVVCAVFVVAIQGIAIANELERVESATEPPEDVYNPLRHNITVNEFEEYNEAPMLKELVEKGEIDTVDKRLPKDPQIIKPFEEIGSYGGTLRGQTPGKIFEFYQSTEGLLTVRLKALGTPVPGVVKATSSSDNNRVWTFKLREGIKFSDGVPFTSEDLLFWYEDVLLNKELNPSIPSLFTLDGEAVKVTAPDKYTIIFESPSEKPLPLFDREVAWHSFEFPPEETPKHYLKQFHIDYADPDELEKRIEEAGVNSWIELFDIKTGHDSNPDLPTLHPWVLETDPAEVTQRAVRNPYFWMVDTEGNQLPYIDYLEWKEVPERDVRAMRVMSREVDIDLRLDPQYWPVLSQEKDEGNYRLTNYPFGGGQGNSVALFVNQNYEANENIAELLKNLKFRQALSLAINRDAINETLQMGMAEKRATCLGPSLPGIGDKYEKYMVEQDVEKANKLLDEIGLDQRNKEGFRVFSDEEKFQLIITGPAWREFRADTAMMIASQLKDNVDLNVIHERKSDSAFWEFLETGKHQMAVYNNQAEANRQIGTSYFPIAPSNRYAPLNGLYYATNGESGIKPEGDIKRLQEIYTTLKTEDDFDRRAELLQEANKLIATNLWNIGLLNYAPWPLVTSNRVKNHDTSYENHHFYQLFIEE